ncbi:MULTISPECIES: sensor histidine kinase [Pseudoalteromonas]|uniref:histidine kinase n=1 Tax=Pseudoalteromonas haloplanktis TaxID=228 RepID=A0ABU1BEW3_PSEHA|nr:MULTISPECIES: ATP-binding protein [Pseudoalteromonas]MDQ9092792.1 histidine kinase dimerization/phospho-acceptor domain-containing protein [Pseudoalteromonas haloplanktis]BDF96333.1 two-component sensor histidine kinase [Pseudoalteromonas sp. KAN5]
MLPHKTKLHSIKRKLVNNITAVISLILVTIFLTVDLSVDSWVENQFNQSLSNKANYLKTLVKDHAGKLEFDFAGEFMSEYEQANASEFYQLWHEQHTFEKSDSLQIYPGVDLPNIDIPINEFKIIDYTLPNGEEGRAMISHFIAQQEDESARNSGHFNTMVLTIAAPTSALNKVLIIIDVVFLLTCIITVFGVRYLVTRIVNRGLYPLNNLNEQIKQLDITGASQTIKSDFKVEEIEPIRNELNKFITTNQQLYQNEKRLTSDIAHELKTPIAELISLSEVALRYPNDERITSTYTSDILAISQRMKTIVNNLLLLQRAGSSAIELNLEKLNLSEFINDLSNELQFKHPDIEQRLQHDIAVDLLVTVDKFCLHTILTNLLDNALFYGVPGQSVNLRVEQFADKTTITLCNALTEPLSEQQLEAIFDPLYQLDSSRTNNQRHGLGLSIVKSLCNLNHFSISAKNKPDTRLALILTLPR